MYIEILKRSNAKAVGTLQAIRNQINITIIYRITLLVNTFIQKYLYYSYTCDHSLSSYFFNTKLILHLYILKDRFTFSIRSDHGLIDLTNLVYIGLFLK